MYTCTVCIVAPGPCYENPCENGGTCSVSDDGDRVCNCAEGWTGEDCDEREFTVVSVVIIVRAQFSTSLH